ncbi:hypothetical protein Z517_03643 [Fonsecaea pedrosoi CBS 271.37]|uniref:Unplaced genomic scaffold supercont1.2, whole genome shotgun sequence n=1 Tax=Fonsecaea pedrosoi CBS 271.37 TaxID=1442368 RepID=A0A0D2GTQ6_9EURO|nr:uncharacterized protein Z517_03643 [Fonsecaea pedrosoi CBS 271.37]KIW84393.1 hypothetical protein Z517_03643 [Fonsecaea pedrosoi CBS 271.37]
MEPHEPWLADFITSSLDAWFGELEGCRTTDYQFHKIDDKLKASYRATCSRTVYLLKLPKLGTIEPCGEISDGIHKIEAIFTKGTAVEIKQSDAQQGTLLHLTNPVLRVTPHVNPPKPLLEIAAYRIVNETDQREQDHSSGCAVTEDKDVRERISRYWAVKEQNRAPLTPASRGSPDSFKSQIDFNAQVHHVDRKPGGDPEEDVSHQLFCTQVPNAFTYWDRTTQIESTSSNENGPATRCDENQSVPPPLSRQGSIGSAYGSPSKQAQRSAPGGDRTFATGKSITPPHESPLALPTTDDPGTELATRALSRSTHPNSPGVQVIPVLTTNYDKSSPVEMSELGGNILGSSRQSADQNHEEIPKLSTKSSPLRPNVVSSAEQPLGHFNRLQEEAQAGRYVPKRIQQIPRQQAQLLASLLESGDCWQPPLVGRPQRPGGVPLDLLVQLSDAADNRASDLGSSLEIAAPDFSTQGVSAAQDSRDEDLKSGTPSEGNVSDSEEFADWSQSPPTQLRRVTRLPPNSPPLDLTRQKQRPHLAGNPNKESPLSSGQEPFSNNPADREQGREPQSLSYEHSPGSLEASSHQSVSSRPSAAEVPQSAQLPQADPSDKSSYQEGMPPKVVGIRGSSKSDGIQVARTPYGGKGPYFPRLVGAQDDLTIQKKKISDGYPASTFVPRTYDEPSSGEIAAVAVMKPGIEALPADEGSNPTAGSAQNSLIAAYCAPQVFQATGIDHTHSRKTPIPARNVSAEDALSASTSSQKVVRSRLVSVGGQDRAAENGFQPSISSDDDGNPPSPAVSASRESISSVSAKRKRTDSKGRNSPVKKLRQEQEAADSDLKNGEIVEKASEDHRQRRGQIDRLENSLRRPASEPRMAAGCDSETLASEQVKQHRLVTLRSTGEPQLLTSRSPRSSRIDTDSPASLVGEAPVHRRQNQRLDSTTLALRRTSTPITRQSAYGGVDEENKSTKADSLFVRYRTAYPDYAGSVDDFLNSYCFVKEIWVRMPWPKAIHQSHLDDAVFHHFHSYQPYTRTAGTAAVGFVEFFHGIEDPSHHQRIIRPWMLEKVPGRGGTPTRSIVGEPSIHERGHLFPTAPVLSTKTANLLLAMNELTAVQQGQFQHVARGEEEAVASCMESIERWREDAARTASPELGTPDVDRSLSRRTTPNRESLDPATIASIPTVSAKPQEHCEVSTGLFVKPPKPVIEVTAGSVKAVSRRSSSARTKKRTSMRDFWRGTGTAFTQFEQQYTRSTTKKTVRAFSETLGTSFGGGKKSR